MKYSLHKDLNKLEQIKIRAFILSPQLV
jgi:hypothetical protein